MPVVADAAVRDRRPAGNPATIPIDWQTGGADLVRAVGAQYGVEPKAENVESGDFKIWSYEHMYVAQDADEVTKAFIEYMLSDAVQGSLVEEKGFIPLTGMKVKKDASGTISAA